MSISAFAAWVNTLEDRILSGAAEGMARGLAETEALAKALAPVQSGALRDSISCAVTREHGGVRGSVGAGAPYAAAVEFGGARPARPFLYPALQQTRGAVTRAVRQGILRKMGGG